MKSKGKSYIFATIIFIIQIISLIGFLSMDINRINQSNNLEISKNYVMFFDEFQNFLVKYTSLMEGFSAYIQTFDEIDNENTYKYLEHLTSKDDGYIKNICVVKNGEIAWCYPKTEKEIMTEENISSIVIQSDNYKFNRSIDLIDGNLGYITFIPIRKDKQYWGMISIVLEFDKVNQLLDNLSEKNKVCIAIVNHLNKKLIYGEPEIIESNSIVFENEYTEDKLDIYVVPEKSSKLSDRIHIFVIFILGLLVALWITSKGHDIYNKLEKNAIFDSLTNIYNRNYFDKKIIEELHKSQNGDYPISIVFFDLDNFKMVNDGFGHLNGDAVLNTIVDEVKKLIRSDDIFARWGGDEFAVIMPMSKLYEASVLAERLRLRIEDTAHPSIGKITASFGVAEYRPHEKIEEFLERADDALYLSKINGRNCVTLENCKNMGNC